MGMRSFIVGLAAWLAMTSTARAVEPPAIPDKPTAEQFKDVPAPWRDYLIQARAAERIADPLRRCLAFPDVPGNHWPAGHAAAHCRHHFAVDRPTLEQIAGMVESKEVAQLDAMMAESLRRHFADADFNEGIHDTFEYLLRNSDAVIVDRLSAGWLEQAPGSAFAHLARGVFYAGSAARARGGKYAAQTPRENLRRMSELIDKAIPHLQQAVAIEPKLIPAYTSMIDMAMRDSRSDLEAAAVAMAEKIDPACVELANVRMRALEPRWGGSYEQMLAYANRLSTYLPQRPHLAIHIGQPYADRGDRLIADDQYTRATLEVLDTAVGIGSDEGALRNAANVALNLTDAPADGYKGLAYLLQETRFEETTAWGERNIAWILVRSEPQWSLKYALLAIRDEPDNALGHYLAGAGYYNTHQYEDADREYRIAIEDAEQRQASLREVADMWLFSGFSKDPAARKAGAVRAKPYIDRLQREYPEDGRGGIMEFLYGMATDGRVDETGLRAILKKIDRSDAWQARHAERFEAMLEQIDGFKQKKPH